MRRIDWLVQGIAGWAKKKPAKTIKITLLGARGAGKTSLLAGIYETFGPHAKNWFLQLIPDRTTAIALSEALKSLTSSVERITVGGYTGTQQSRTYDFNLGLPYRDGVIKLEFRDYPGEWFQDLQKSKDILRYVIESDVVLWAIDAAAIMEAHGSYDEQFNNTLNIRSLVAEALTQSPQGHKKLFLLVPIKCETYLQTGKVKDLLDLVEERFACNIKGQNSHIGVAITCVQTLGNVRFNHIEGQETNAVRFIHQRTSKDNPYQPRHLAQVLDYMLPFILRRYLEQNRWFDNDTRRHFEQAINEMSEKRIRNEQEGFKILSGEKLMN